MTKLLFNICFACLLFLAFQKSANAQLLEGDAGGGSAYVNEYSVTGVPIASPLAHVQAGDLEGIAVSGNDLFTADSYSGTVGEYNLTTGQPINPSFISLPFAGSYGIAVSNNILYVTNNSTLYAFDITGPPIALWTVSNLGATAGVTVAGTNVFVINGSSNGSSNGIGEYNALTGTVESANLVTGLYDTFSLTTDGNYLYTSSYAGGTVSKFTLSGQTVNANLVTGIPDGANGLAVSANKLYVADIFQVQEYDATTGAYVRTINSGMEQANSVVVVPEPDAAALVIVALVMIGAWKLGFCRKAIQTIN
jgi:hypothetical protein